MTTEKELVKCDGWGADLGCDGTCVKTKDVWRYGGRQLCGQCAKRLEDDNRHWAYITR
jgi:hypothetical protein